MRIHAIQTGTVAIKTRQIDAVGHGLRRQLNTLTDCEWTEPLPIYAFAIDHPEGVIAVDTARLAERRTVNAPPLTAGPSMIDRQELAASTRGAPNGSRGAA